MSGDQAETVNYIARRLGIAREPHVVNGEDIENLAQDDLVKILTEREVVFARIAPEQNLNSVEALKSIVRAVEQGRALYDNVRKFVTYILTSNVPEVLCFVAYVLFPTLLPISVVQILAIDLITDILPAIGLGNEPPEAELMQRPPPTR